MRGVESYFGGVSFRSRRCNSRDHRTVANPKPAANAAISLIIIALMAPWLSPAN